VENALWETLLRTAVTNGQIETAQWVLQSSAIQPQQSLRLLSVALEDASRLGHLSIVRMLLSNVSETSTPDFTGSLYWAARGGHTEVLAALLDALTSDGSVLTIVDALAGAVYCSPKIVSQVL